MKLTKEELKSLKGEIDLYDTDFSDLAEDAEDVLKSVLPKVLGQLSPVIHSILADDPSVSEYKKSVDDISRVFAELIIETWAPVLTNLKKREESDDTDEDDEDASDYDEETSDEDQPKTKMIRRGYKVNPSVKLNKKAADELSTLMKSESRKGKTSKKVKKRFYSIADVATMLGKGYLKINRLLLEGRVPDGIALRIDDGGIKSRWMFNIKATDEWMDNFWLKPKKQKVVTEEVFDVKSAEIAK